MKLFLLKLKSDVRNGFKMRFRSMERKESPQKLFEKEYTRSYDVLKKFFLDKMEKASDKLYAYNHFKKVLFEKNLSISHNTVFIEEIKDTFNHIYKLDQENVVQLTLKSIPKIRKHSLEEYNQALHLSFLHENNPPIEELPYWYQNGITNDGCKLEDLLQKENQLSEISEIEIIKLIAFYHATQQLLIDVEEFYPIEKETQSPKKDYKHQFTRSQQVLTAHYLFKMAGIGIRQDIDVTACAEILHVMLGLPYNKIANSELYKKFLNPFGNSSPKATIQDLEVIRKYFEKLNNQDILNSIDEQIKCLKKK